MQQPIRKTKNFVKKHRVALAVTATSIVAVKWVGNIQSYNKEFLQSHGLYEAYLASFAE